MMSVSYTHLGVDLQLLGIGHNGHIGFNEPGESFDKQVHCVNLTESTICLLYTSLIYMQS